MVGPVHVLLVALTCLSEGPVTRAGMVICVVLQLSDAARSLLRDPGEI